MAKDLEEIGDADPDVEIDSELEEDADGESDDSKESKESEKDEKSEDDEPAEGDSDDEDNQPVTMGALKKLLAASGKNRSAAAARVLKKRDLTNGARETSKEADRFARIEERQDKLDHIEEKRQFGFANSLAPDEVDVVFRLTKRPTTKSLEDPVIRGALDGYRKAKRLKDNTPSSNGRPARVGARPVKEENLTAGERKERFADRRRQILAGKQGR